MKYTFISLFFVSILFFVVSSYASSSAGKASVLAKTPVVTPGVSTSFAIIGVTLALCALVFAVKKREDKYEEE